LGSLRRGESAATARLYLIGGGVLYLVLWFYGLLVDQQGGPNFVPFNTADNWLHFVLGVGMIGLGFATTRERRLVPVSLVARRSSTLSWRGGARRAADAGRSRC
jgi:hypothetical protein